MKPTLENSNTPLTVLSCLLSIALLGPISSYNALASTEAKSTIELNEQLQELNQRYEQLNERIKKDKRTLKKSLRKIQQQNQALQFRGFFSSGIATSDGKAKLRLLNDNQEIGDEPNFQSDAIVGLQLDAVINNRTRYTHQLTTAGFDINHTLKTEWAYFTLSPSDQTSIKAGRLRIPFFLLSESVEVGFTYPWARPPVEIYTLPISSYEGVAVEQQFKLMGGYARTSIYAGSGLNTVSALLNANLLLNDFKGISFDYHFGSWLLHLNLINTQASFIGNKPCNVASVNAAIFDVAFNGQELVLGDIDCAGVDILSNALALVDTFLVDTSVSGLYNPIEFPASYVDIALKYDNGSSLIIAEYGEVKIKGWLNPLGPAGYILYGYRLNKWLPYLSIGSLTTSDGTRNDVNVIAERISDASAPLGPAAAANISALLVDAGILVDYQSYTLGVNYWLNTNLRAKLEVAHYGRFKNTNGFFLSDPGSHIAIYSFVIDGVF